MCHLLNWHSELAPGSKCGILKEWRGAGPRFFILFIMEFFKATATTQSYYWERVAIAVKSWSFRMSTLTDEDVQTGAYCDKYQWSRSSDEVQNFWVAINEGYIDMIFEATC